MRILPWSGELEAFQKLKNVVLLAPLGLTEGCCFPLRGCKGRDFSVQADFRRKRIHFQTGYLPHPVWTGAGSSGSVCSAISSVIRWTAPWLDLTVPPDVVMILENEFKGFWEIEIKCNPYQGWFIMEIIHSPTNQQQLYGAVKQFLTGAEKN